ncbi:hypothetical protein ACVWWK_005261 [Bradyrhizobium sp. LB9.1b]
MPERVVDALELVDVDIVHRELFARGDESQFLAQMLVEQGAVGQVGQRVVMSEMGDALLDAPALRDVLVCRHPAAVRERFVDDLDRATVGGVDHHRIAHMDVAQDPCDIRVHIAGERAGGAAVRNDVVEATAGSHYFGRQPVHLYVALIADHELLRGVEQQQALGHVVDGAVKTLLFQRQPFPRKAVLLKELAHDRDQDARDGERGRGGDRDQDADLLAPVHQCRRARRGSHHQDREVGQGTRGDQPVLAVDGTHEAAGEVIEPEDPLVLERTVLEISSHQFAGMGISGQQRAVPMQHRDPRAFAEHDGLEEFFEACRLDAASDHTHEFAVRSDDLAHDEDGPGSGDATVQWLDQDVGSIGIISKGPEIGAIGDVQFRDWPCRRRIDQIAFGIDDVDAASPCRAVPRSSSAASGGCPGRRGVCDSPLHW